jgi:transglutaminase-like putative cysteine protease
MEYNGKKILAKPNGNTYDIIEALINITPQAIQQVKSKINTLVKLTGNAYIDAKTIAKFIRDNVTYKADGYENQNIQLPGRLVNGTKLGDCKSFSLLFVSMMKTMIFMRIF